MSIEINSTYTAAVYTSSTTVTTTTTAATEAQAKDGAKKTNEDKFVKEQQYKPDMEKIKEMKSEMKGNMKAFQNMVQGLMQQQGKYAGQASGISLKNLFEKITVDPATKKAAQEAISEDGEWGVEATANRIVDFAKALSGGDPAKIETLKNAVEKGFKAAEQAWGGKLPDISDKTYNRVMELFDEWEKGGAEPEVPAAEEK